MEPGRERGHPAGAGMGRERGHPAGAGIARAGKTPALPAGVLPAGAPPARALLGALALGALMALLGAGPASAAPEDADRRVPGTFSSACLDCHGNPAFSTTLASGEELSLFVDEGQITRSAHQEKLICVDCHRRITTVPHRGPAASSRREYSTGQYEVCKRCHFANYTRTLDSVHHQAMEAGDPRAPLCTDCHGYHQVSRPGRPRSDISATCGGCHRDVYEEYARSVHGARVAADGEKGDAPVCTDCHGAHAIRSASLPSFRRASPEQCARCHADETLARRYNLSSNVFRTYVQEFQGATVVLARSQGSEAGTGSPVCADCHGAHGVGSTRAGFSSQFRLEVVAACERCHPGAGASFLEAWLVHHEPGMERASLTSLVQAMYTVVIPLMIGGLAVHIVVDLWRIARNR